ncbi:phosphorylase [Paraphotobacterium marinum]|uniref:Phosphorylase n=1 Tax=Paraphotobacterium marinum TaxID=1755811 RepID=A0A220VCN3_9GAMM|nr:phosphorylase [Paraphotobacterium marinum]ASK77733.1 phosphorylase [Paraphotobacterium marinum]
MWEIGKIKSSYGINSGDLLPLTTTDIEVNIEGVNYIVNLQTDNMQVKHNPKVSLKDPFLPPYNTNLFVENIGPEHVCLLNKFPIKTPHLLVCATKYIPQTTALKLTDFKAWVKGIKGQNILGFFNSGRAAGSSQSHRHMQLIQTDLPLESVIINNALPFKHNLLLLDQLNAEELYSHYLSVMSDFDLYTSSTVNGFVECFPYNILLTERWMLLIPRYKNEVYSMKGHGVNFVGRFLVNSMEQFEWLKEYGFMNFLIQCGFSK